MKSNTPAMICTFMLVIILLITSGALCQQPDFPDTGFPFLPDVFAEKTREIQDVLLTIKSSNYLDYDEEHDFIYGRERTTITYKEKYKLTGDRVLIDVRLKEVHAEGNVILESAGGTMHAESMVYNFEKDTGSATDVYGQRGSLYFKGPTFDRLSEEEAVLRKDSVTTCDFKIPHYRIRAKEFIIYIDDRIFARNSVFYIREIPCFYLPVYTRSLWEQSPWHITIGSSSHLGTFLRIGYNYRSTVEIPDPITGKQSTYSKRRIVYSLDWFSDAGVGYGIKYSYNLRYGKHKGLIDLFAINDKFRTQGDDDEDDISFADGTWGDEDESSDTRYKINLKHRSQVADDLAWTLFADIVSDPELYEDFFDDFGKDRGRIADRRAFTALTLTKDDFIFRVLFELKERLSRDRLSNFSESTDDDLDYEIDTNREFDSSRYGRVSQRMPQINFTTRYLNLGKSRWYYNLDVNALNNLYRGLNVMSGQDDTFVQGLDIYQSLLRRIKFSEKYTLLAKLGIGVGFFNFDDDGALDVDFSSGTTFPTTVDGLTFVDEDTFLIGEHERNFSDVSDGFIYADANFRFTARFTDYLKATVKYRFREGTQDSLGDFLDSLGDTDGRGGLYNFRLHEHWLEGDLTLSFEEPDLSISLLAGHNLQSSSDIYGNELLTYLGIAATYQNKPKTLTISPSIYYKIWQLRDPSDKYSIDQAVLTYGVSATYTPIHNRWYMGGRATFVNVLDEDPLYQFYKDAGYYDDDDDFDENEDKLYATIYYGTKIGTKWLIEIRGRYDDDGEQRQQIMLARDLHDWLAQLIISHEKDDYRTEDDQENNLEFKFKLSLKSPNEEIRPTDLSISTILTEKKLAELDEEGIY